jgi:hypothetical protein
MVMPFGLTNAPTIFMTLMNSLFQKYLGRFVLMFMDDILVHSKSRTKHLEHLRITFEILRTNQLYAKMNNYEFGVPQVDYLRHVVSYKGVAADAKKIRVVVEWPTPKDKIEVRSFLGLADYYKRFMKNFSQIAKPLINLLKGENNSQGIQWDPICEQSFQDLKNALNSDLVFGVINPKMGGLVLCIDVSDLAIGVMLMQEGKIIAYKSRKLTLAKLNYPTHERSYLL